VRALLASLVLAAVIATGAPSAQAAERIHYVAPVPGRVVDEWRPPAQRFGAGNVGIDLDARPGDPVRASAAGEVTFAGPIGGRSHVVILHPDGLRTTYAFLESATVGRGRQVAEGDVVGTASGPVHFGVRDGDRYLDPTALLANEVEVHLVPERDRRPLSERDERSAVVRFVSGIWRGGAAAAGWVAGEAADVVGLAWLASEQAARFGWDYVQTELQRIGRIAVLLEYYTSLPAEWLAVLGRMAEYRKAQSGCTPRGDAPAKPVGRRIAVLVGGFGSSSDEASIADLDTGALGYADGDVARFSYRGGQVAGGRGMRGIARSDYDEADANADLRTSARRLRELLEDIRIAHPGVPVDVIGHSQGGVVARAALAGAEANDPRLASVASLITIGAPHHGADLATGAQWLGTSTSGTLSLAGAEAGFGLDADATAIGQLAETSSFIRELNAAHVPPGIRFTSIASSGDLLVPAVHSAVGEAVDVLVPDPPGLGVHLGLPGTDAVEREVALALAGMGPTCRRITGAFLQSLGASVVEDALGGGLGGVAHWVDARLRTKPALDVAGTEPVPR
jgi:Peptidase family M23/PGAP1-like protein